uniref:Polysaccharide pyruvyl transferase domain-containing protein n=1 Tax=Plectus sambesii TaxID=2011161 RepID=A0A914XDL8_9BILA
MSHKAWPYIHSPFGRSMKAVNLALKFYAQARLVITSRLHAAMPCVGLKTPVIFLRTEELPGGAAGRIEGLDQLWHTYDVTNDAKTAETTELLRRFNWTSPPFNPNKQMALELKKKMLNHIFHESPQFISVATMFGWIKNGTKDDDQ